MKKILKRIYYLFFPKSVNGITELLFVRKGSSVIITDTATLSTSSSNGLIILEGNNYLGKDVEIGAASLIIIGQNTSIQHRCILLGDIEIGANCLFADNVYISSGRHYFDLMPEMCIKDQDEYVMQDAKLSKSHSQKIIIGEDCWIGTNAVIMSGITIGKGTIIGANSVITKDVPPYSIVGGIPGKTLKKRLEFEPPDFINYKENKYLPYFYKGFFVREADLNLDRLEEGIACGKKFIVAMKAAGENPKIKIQFKKQISQSVKISFQGQLKNIETNDWYIFEFDLKYSSNSLYEFFIEEGSLGYFPKKILLIKSIQIE